MGVDTGCSRCGICNAKLWCSLLPSDVAGRVPSAVLEAESEFYQCGGCRQIFWAGEKYMNTMDSLKAHAFKTADGTGNVSSIMSSEELLGAQDIAEGGQQ